MTLGVVVTSLTGLLFAIGSLLGIRLRWLSREARDRRELREMNVEAMGYIYDMEMALVEASKALGRKITVEKPEILKRSFLEAKAAQEDKGNTFTDMAQVVEKLHQDGKNALNGGSEK
jgi:hypothetical protein